MKFHLLQGSGNVFTGMGPGYVEINRERYDGGLVVLPERIVRGWAAAGFEGLTAADFAQILAYEPELVVFGSGAALRFPHPSLIEALGHARVGVEVMDTPAACRTFNILAAEDRRVAAAILIDPAPAPGAPPG